MAGTPLLLNALWYPPLDLNYNPLSHSLNALEKRPYINLYETSANDSEELEESLYTVYTRV